MSDSSLSLVATALQPAYARGETASNRGQAGRGAAAGADAARTAKVQPENASPLAASTAAMPAGAGTAATSNPAAMQAVMPGQRPASPENGQTRSTDATAARQALAQEAAAKEAAEKARADQEAQGKDPVSRDELNQVVESINDFLQSSKRSLEFSVDDSSGRTIIKVMDAEKEKVIRQIPPESALELIERFRDGDGIAATGLMEKA